MNILNMIKKKLGITRDYKKWSPDNIQCLLSECDEKISKLNKELKATQDQNSTLQTSLNTKITENNKLRASVSSLEKEIKDQAETLKETKSLNDELRKKNLYLQEENELLVGRSSNNMSKLINFCELLKTMEISSVEDCIAIIRNEIMSSTAEMGFDVVDSYEGEFNPEIHTIIETQSTNETNLNNHVAKVVRPGVWYDNKCLIPQGVVVYTIIR